MSDDLRVPVDRLVLLAGASDAHYSTFVVDGRRIEAPDRELKLVQSWIADFVRAETHVLPSYVTAYEVGSSIVRNAAVHQSSAHLLSLDIHHFFHSCDRRKVTEFLRRVDYVDRSSGTRRPLGSDDADALAALASYRGHLSMGSPCSPAIANRIMLPLDERIVSGLPAGTNYTRYSDDISISSDSRLDLDGVVALVRGVLGSAGFALNDRKTHCRGRGESRRVTGVFITPEGDVSIGRRRKDELNRMLYRHLVGPVDDAGASAARILGYLRFCLSVEPRYVGGVMAKYSNYGRARDVPGGLVGLLEAEVGETG